jgi:hypothetical protein
MDLRLAGLEIAIRSFAGHPARMCQSQLNVIKYGSGRPIVIEVSHRFRERLSALRRHRFGRCARPKAARSEMTSHQARIRRYGIEPMEHVLGAGCETSSSIVSFMPHFHPQASPVIRLLLLLIASSRVSSTGQKPCRTSPSIPAQSLG